MSTATTAARNPVETAGRIGYAFKGVLYALLGVLAVQTAFGGGETEGQTGALRTVAAQPFGNVLLIVLAVGLVAYALWRLATAILDVEGHGTDASGVVHRVGYFFSAVAYGFLAYTAVQILGGSGGGDGGVQEQAQTVFSLPLGRYLVGAAGVAFAGFGARELKKAYTADFMHDLRFSAHAVQFRDTARMLGRAGLTARGVVYGVIGVALLVAAIQHDPGEARGLDGALQTLRDQPFGPWILAAVGVGLAAYGLYCGVMATYREFESA